MYLKQSTATTILIGPALDSTDGVTPETALSPTVYVSKAGAAQAARSSASAITHDRDGWYRVPLDTTDTNTRGELQVQFAAAGALPVWQRFVVLYGPVYDALIAATGNLNTHVVSMGTDALTAAALKADAVSEIQTGLSTLTATQVRTEMDANSTKLANLDTTVGSRLASASYTAPDNAGITSLLARLTATRAGLLDYLDAAISTRLAAGSYTAPDNATITAIATYVDTEVAAIKAVVDKLGAMIETDGADYRFDANALELAPAGAGGGGSLSAADVWAYTPRTLTSSAGGVVGPGASPVPITITDGTNPLDGVAVWISTDAAGANVIAGTLYTDALGQVTFMLDAGTYYVWKQKARVNFTNPEVLTV